LTDNSHDNVLTGNMARNNLRYGFSTNGGDTNMFSQDTAGGNFSVGFDILSSGNTLSKCMVVGNGDVGIVIGGSMNAIKGNRVLDNLSGILINGSSQIVSGNTVMGNRSSGIRLAASTGSTISANTVDGNYGSGIDVTSFSSGNTLISNTAMNDGLAFGGFDLEDDSSGSGTAATANTWAGNHALTRNPAGLL